MLQLLALKLVEELVCSRGTTTKVSYYFYL
jgi:hypothetical protein